MDVSLAHTILHLPEDELHSLHDIRKQYLRLALQHHPDKNQNSEASVRQFQLLQEAYHVLVAANKDKSKSNNHEGEEEEPLDQNQPNPWMDMVRAFLANVMEGNYQDIWFQVIAQLVSFGKHASQTLLDNVDHDSILTLYDFLSKHRASLHLSTETFAFLQELIRTRCAGLQIFKLNPSLEDLRQHKLYKLHLENQCYLVPLWSPESYYQNSVLVLCEPELPANMWLDEDRNLCARIGVSWNTLGKHFLERTPLSLGILLQDEILIPLEQIQLTHEPQFFAFPEKGITRFQPDNLMDVSHRDDLFVFLTLIG